MANNVRTQNRRGRQTDRDPRRDDLAERLALERDRATQEAAELRGLLNVIAIAVEGTLDPARIIAPEDLGQLAASYCARPPAEVAARIMTALQFGPPRLFRERLASLLAWVANSFGPTTSRMIGKKFGEEFAAFLGGETVETPPPKTWPGDLG